MTIYIDIIVIVATNYHQFCLLHAGKVVTFKDIKEAEEVLAEQFPNKPITWLLEVKQDRIPNYLNKQFIRYEKGMVVTW